MWYMSNSNVKKVLDVKVWNVIFGYKCGWEFVGKYLEDSRYISKKNFFILKLESLL